MIYIKNRSISKIGLYTKDAYIKNKFRNRDFFIQKTIYNKKIFIII